MQGRARIVILGLVAVLLGGGAVTAVTIGMQRGTAVAATVNGEVIYVNELNGQVDTLAKQYGLDVGTADGARQRAEISRVVLEDRKSTRLNSSHLVISYAVFCLKKKKKRTKHQQRCYQ